MSGPHIGDRIGPLVSWAEERVLWPWGTLLVGDGSEGLKGVAENIKTTVCRHSLWHEEGVEGVDDAQCWSQCSVGNPSLGFEGFVVKDRHSCCLTPSPSCCRYCGEGRRVVYYRRLQLYFCLEELGKVIVVVRVGIVRI